MPSSVTILCQIKSKGQDGGFISSLASYIIKPGTSKILHYSFYKKQISLFLYDFAVGDYTLLCGKCVFNRGIMYVSINTLYIYHLVKKTMKFTHLFIIIGIGFCSFPAASF
jgi:hypothetical protein